MAATTQILTGKVKFPVDPNRVKDFGSGPRVNIAIETDPSQPLIRIYGSPGDPLLTRYRKGDSISVVSDGKGYKILEQPASNGATIGIPSEPHAPEHRFSPEELSDQYADLYLRIWDRLGETLMVSDEIRHTATATVFIQVCRDRGNR